MSLAPKPVYLAGRFIGYARTTVEAAERSTESGIPIDPRRPSESVARLVESRDGFHIDLRDAI